MHIVIVAATMVQLFGGVLDRHENYQYFQQIAGKRSYLLYGVLVALTKVSLDEYVHLFTYRFLLYDVLYTK